VTGEELTDHAEDDEAVVARPPLVPAENDVDHGKAQGKRSGGRPQPSDEACLSPLRPRGRSPLRRRPGRNCAGSSARRLIGRMWILRIRRVLRHRPQHMHQRKVRPAGV